MRRRRRHRQGNFEANCVRGALATSARFAAKFCRRGFQRAAEPSTACGGYSEAEQGQQSQSASAIRTPQPGEIAALGNCRARLLSPFLQRVKFLDTRNPQVRRFVVPGGQSVFGLFEFGFLSLGCEFRCLALPVDFGRAGRSLSTNAVQRLFGCVTWVVANQLRHLA